MSASDTVKTERIVRTLAFQCESKVIWGSVGNISQIFHQNYFILHVSLTKKDFKKRFAAGPETFSTAVKPLVANSQVIKKIWDYLTGLQAVFKQSRDETSLELILTLSLLIQPL